MKADTRRIYVFYSIPDEETMFCGTAKEAAAFLGSPSVEVFRSRMTHNAKRNSEYVIDKSGNKYTYYSFLEKIPEWEKGK